MSLEEREMIERVSFTFETTKIVRREDGAFVGIGVYDFTPGEIVAFVYPQMIGGKIHYDIRVC